MRKYPYERLDGSVRAEERFSAIRSFSQPLVEGCLNSQDVKSSAFVFMISTRAGGVGLNLVAADTVSSFKVIFTYAIIFIFLVVFTQVLSVTNKGCDWRQMLVELMSLS